MKELREIIASNISALRTEKKLTQCKLAEILNYSDKAVSKWERGESLPDIEVLAQIADYFGVSVDFLISENHDAYYKSKKSYSKAEKINHFVIASLGVVLVFLISTVLFVQFNITNTAFAIPSWLVFLYAAPTGSVVALIFNSIWGRGRINYIIISILLWTVLLCAYLTLYYLGYNLWLIFILGIPGQLIIALWSVMRKTSGTEEKLNEA